MATVAAPLPLRARAELERRKRAQKDRAASRSLGPPPVETFQRFVQRQNPTLLQYEHVPRLVSVGEKIIAGELDRVMILMPPRYFKSEVYARLLSSAFLRRYPRRWVGLGSYGAKLANELSLESRTYFKADGGALSAGASGKELWRSAEDGGMWAAGVGGPMLGLGYHLGIVDDPTDPEKAVSPTYQRRFEKWWPGKFLSRAEPNAAIVVVMQRLGPADPIDFLLRREVGEQTDEAPEFWHVVVCDEVKSNERLGRWDGPRGLPPTCTIEEDPREDGAVLSPTRFSQEAVRRKQIAAGPVVRAAQLQQRPRMLAGDFWKKDWFDVYEDLPRDAFNGGKDWDTAYTKEEHNSASAFVESYRGPGKPDEFPIYIHNIDWNWYEFPELVAWMRGQKGPHYVEQKATGKSIVQTLRRESISATEVRVDGGDKLARASSAQPIVSNRRIRVRRSVLRQLLEGDRQGLWGVTAEALMSGDGDLDLNDAFVQAIHRHTRPRATLDDDLLSTSHTTI